MNHPDKEDKTTRTIPFTVDENFKLVELYLKHKQEYNAKPPFIKNGPSNQDKFAAEWARTLSGISGHKRTMEKVKRRILDMKAETRKYYNQKRPERERTGSARPINYPLYYINLIEDIARDNISIEENTESKAIDDASSKIPKNECSAHVSVDEETQENPSRKRKSRSDNSVNDSDELTKLKKELLMQKLSNARLKGEILEKKKKLMDMKLALAEKS